MAYGCLSGMEIADAVKRQQAFQKLKIKALERSGLVIPGNLSLWDRMKFWWLERQPRIHIDDFDETPSDLGGPLNPNSYNLDLADELLVYNLPVMTPEIRHSPMLKPEEWENYALDVKKNNPTKKIVIPDQGMILKPNRLYLGRTIQHTETYNLVPRLDGRSSIGRLGICIHITAAFGDVGYKGTWTLEITVVHPVRIYPNMRICQISYASTKPGGRQYAGRYQNATDVAASRFHLGNAVQVASASDRPTQSDVRQLDADCVRSQP